MTDGNPDMPQTLKLLEIDLNAAIIAITHKVMMSMPEPYKKTEVLGREIEIMKENPIKILAQKKYPKLKIHLMGPIAEWE